MIQNYLKTINFTREGEIGIKEIKIIGCYKKDLVQINKLLLLWGGILLLVLAFVYTCNNPVEEYIQLHIKPYYEIDKKDMKDMLVVWRDYLTSNKISNLNVNEITVIKSCLSISIFILYIVIIVKEEGYKNEIESVEMSTNYNLSNLIYLTFFLVSIFLLWASNIVILKKVEDLESKTFVLFGQLELITIATNILIVSTILKLFILGGCKCKINDEIKNKTTEMERLGLSKYNFSKEALLSDINKKKQKSKEYEDAILMSKELMLNIIDRDKSKHSVLENQALDRLTQETLERARKTDKELVELHFNANKMMIND